MLTFFHSYFQIKHIFVILFNITLLCKGFKLTKKGDRLTTVANFILNINADIKVPISRGISVSGIYHVLTLSSFGIIQTAVTILLLTRPIFKFNNIMPYINKYLILYIFIIHRHSTHEYFIHNTTKTILIKIINITYT